MIRDFTCIVCPTGCDIHCEIKNGAIIQIDGAGCRRGEDYVRQEIYDPRRTIASSVLVDGGELPLVSVRLNRPIPRDRIFDVMQIIQELRLTAPVLSGTVLVSDILGLGADLIATRSVACIDRQK